MPQQEMTSSQELTAGGGGTINGGNSGGSFLTGTICTASGTFVAENKYLRAVCAVAAGDPFPPMMDGKKIYWTALTTAVAAAKDSSGGLTGVKVEAGAA